MISKLLGKILCLCGLHKWMFVEDNNIFPFTPYKYCKRCGKLKTNF